MFLSSISAQDKETPAPRRKGSITGRVVAVDGQPMTNARVFVSPAGAVTGASRSFTTDEEGNFIADGLLSGAYSISANSPAHVYDLSSEQRPVYRLGETATITMRKGGVITGRVTTAQGEPLQDVGINTFRVRDEAGRKVTESESRGDMTDDRGVYRVFGLQPGSYLVSVSGGDLQYRYGGPASPYDESAPIYYPSSSRTSATQIKVQAGEEVQGIDIQFRSEKGHRISGTVTGLPLKSATGERAFSGASLRLHRLPGFGDEQSSYTYESQEQKAFVFHGVADGEYEIRASSGDWRNEDGVMYTSLKRRITVKGNDVSGVVIVMSLLASVAGQVVVEVTPEKERKPECPAGRTSALEEILVSTRRATTSNELSLEEDRFNRPQRIAPNDKGEFKLRALETGRYYLNAQLPNETWFIKSIILKSALASPISNLQSSMAKPVDVGKQGLNLKPGDKLTGLTMTIAEGAASVQGRVMADKPLPTRMRVHLIPAEKEAADEVLRYHEFTTKADGAFTFPHLAPGKYWLLTRAVPDDESDETPSKPVAWDANERVKLRQAAEMSNQMIELKPCQRVSDYGLRFSTAK